MSEPDGAERAGPPSAPPPVMASPGHVTPADRSWRRSARRIAEIAWPVFVGQLSVLAFSTVDTLLVARYSTVDLAALAVGAAAYITVFIGFMGVVMAIGPIVGQLYGARQFEQAGRHVHQTLWLALTLSVLGSVLLVFPAPFLALSQATPEVADRVRAYLSALAFALPASLLFSVYRGFNVAISRPKAVMALQLMGLAVKVPASTALVWGVPWLGVPRLGVLGCGIATALAMWSQTLMAWRVMRRDRFYEPYALHGRGLDAPDRQAIGAHLRLGIPMGLTILIDVTGFSFMAIFIARLGTTAVAGQQIVANLAALLFMLPLAIGHATGTLVAQRVGARDAVDARLLGRHGLALGLALAFMLGSTVFLAREPVIGTYTGDPHVAAAALGIVGWMVVFHVADAGQAVAGSVLRAYRIAKVPLVVNAVALGALGLGGGYLLAFDVLGGTPASLTGPTGFWAAATAGLALAALSLGAWQWRVQRLPPSSGDDAAAG